MTKQLFIVAIAVASVLVGCSSSEPNATASDKANLERLHKEGIGKVMADQAGKDGGQTPSLANPDGGPGPARHGP